MKNHRNAVCSRSLPRTYQQGSGKLFPVWRNHSTKTSGIGFTMKNLQGQTGKQTNLIGLVLFCLGLLIASSPLEAQSNESSASVQTNRPTLDNSLDPLHQVSASLQALSKRVSPSVVQIFSTGYKPDSDRDHRNTDLLSRGLTSGSGIIIESDGW